MIVIELEDGNLIKSNYRHDKGYLAFLSNRLYSDEYLRNRARKLTKIVIIVGSIVFAIGILTIIVLVKKVFN